MRDVVAMKDEYIVNKNVDLIMQLRAVLIFLRRQGVIVYFKPIRSGGGGAF